jgi:hypothetical protein
MERGEKGLLRQALFLAALGSGLSVFIRGLVTYNYFAEKKFEWIWGYTHESTLIFVPIGVFIFLTSVYFFFICYRELNKQ